MMFMSSTIKTVLIHNIRMKTVLFSILLLMMVVPAYAAPLDEVRAVITDASDVIVTIQLSWNEDETVVYYEVGCVSCQPNIRETTIENFVTLRGVTLLDNGSVLLYVLAYDEGDTHMQVKQILITLQAQGNEELKK